MLSQILALNQWPMLDLAPTKELLITFLKALESKQKFFHVQILILKTT
jgi:hypothetical protein